MKEQKSYDGMIKKTALHTNPIQSTTEGGVLFGIKEVCGKNKNKK